MRISNPANQAKGTGSYRNDHHGWDRRLGPNGSAVHETAETAPADPFQTFGTSMSTKNEKRRGEVVRVSVRCLEYRDRGTCGILP